MLSPNPLDPQYKDIGKHCHTVVHMWSWFRSLFRFPPFAFALGILVATVALFPVDFHEASAESIDDHLASLIVHSGTRTLFGRAMHQIVPEFGRDFTIETRASSMNAMGAARHELGLPNNQGLLLEITPASRSHQVGMRNGDIVTSVTIDRTLTDRSGGTTSSCNPAATLRARWEALEGCAGYVTLTRTHGSTTVVLHVPERSIGGARAYDVASTIQPLIPSSLSGVRGPSAGLVLALHYLDEMTDGSLIGARLVPATGGIDPGTYDVTDIGDITYKAAASAATPARLLLVPKGQVDVPARYPGLDIVGVSTLRDAVAVLCRAGSDDALCRP